MPLAFLLCSLSGTLCGMELLLLLLVLRGATAVAAAAAASLCARYDTAVVNVLNTNEYFVVVVVAVV